MKITMSTGLSFFIRTIYLKNFPIDRLVINEHLNEEEYKDIEDAGCIFSAEQDAMNYLARAEQCRYMLSIKLKKKNHNKSYIKIALDYLESKNYLNDARYAEAWLRNRQITKAEGRVKLEAGLLSKGINHNVVNTALDNYFTTITEEELFNRALLKFKRLGKTEKKLQTALLRAGFSWKFIKNI